MSDFGHVQVGHPVDVASGSVFTRMDDFVLGGTIPLAWSRFYSTDTMATVWLGRGWVVPWFITLERIDDGYRLTDERGRTLVFPVPEGADLQVGGRIIKYGANMELMRQENHFTIDHWHYGMDDVTRFCFPAAGGAQMPLAWVANSFGHRILVMHDSFGRPVRLRQEIEERSVELIYRADNLIDSVVHVLDDGTRKHLVRYQYDSQRRLVAAYDAMESRTSYQYDERDRLVQETNVLGSSFHFRYDAAGRCTHTYGDNGYFERRLRYSAAERATRVTDSLGNVTAYFLNAAGQVIQEVSPRGATTTTEYDEFGRPLSIQNPLGAVLRYEYDAHGNRSAVIHEDGGRSEMSHNDVHLLRAYTSPSGATWTFDYNDRAEEIGLTTPLGDHYSVTRDSRGLVLETRAPTGAAVKRRYGPALRWVEASDDISLLSRTECDESGNQTAFFDAEGLVQRIVYDRVGHPIAAVDRVGRAYHFAWNELGEMVEQSGPDVAWERRTYDGFGQLVEHANPLGVLRIEYDREGRITRIINRANETLTWAYDADGWLITETGFDGRIERFEYDLCGHLVRRVKADGRSVSQAFDPCGAIVRRESSDGDLEEFAYDKDGRLLKARNRAADIVLERDETGRVTAEVQNSRRVEYAHDADGDRSGRRITGIDSIELRFQRDARKRLISLADDSGICLELRWDNVNRLIERRFSDHVTERLHYDTLGRLREQTLSSRGLGPQVERRYEYDGADNLVAREERKHGRSAFGYDALGRLTSVTDRSGVIEHYIYDPNGAILETHRGRRVLASGGKALEEGSRRYTYGSDGALQRIDGAGGVTSLLHDTGGQLTKVTLPDGRVVGYEYDALGRRVAKDVDGVRTEFVWEGPVLAAECRNGEAVQTHYLFAFEPLMQWEGSKRLLPVKDQSGIVREVCDTQGTVLWEGRFEAYATAITQSGHPLNPFRLRGQYSDAETGLCYNFYRSYSPLLADYTAPDPIGVGGGTHFYAYVRNPLQWDDPFGLKCGTAACGEKSMDGYFGQQGYKKIGARGKNPNANGIDAIYYKKGGKPPYIIAEAKNGGGYLHGDQMSDSWINRAPGNADPNRDRLDRAFPPDSPYPDRIRAAAAPKDSDKVGVVVYNPEKDPKVTNYGTYGGENSTSGATPPRNTGQSPV
jgi:RHS repeat-associated protein